MVHTFAQPQSLESACNQVFAIRKLYDPKGAYEDLLNTCAGVVALFSGMVGVMFLVALTGDPLFGWRGGTAERTIFKLIAAGVVILVGFALGAVPVYLSLTKLGSAALLKVRFKGASLKWHADAKSSDQTERVHPHVEVTARPLQPDGGIQRTALAWSSKDGWGNPQISSTSPQDAHRLLFEEAASALPIMTAEQAKTAFSTVFAVARHEGKAPITGTAEELQPIVLRVLDQVAARADFGRFEISLELNPQHLARARVKVFFFYGGGDAISLWRTADKSLIFSELL